MSSENFKRHHDEDSFLTDEDVDRLIVATAAGRNAESKPFCEQDADQVIRWAKGTRIGCAMLSLVLAGEILPMGSMDDGQIGFGFVDTALSQADAKAYREKLAELQAGWKWTLPREFVITGDDDLGFMLAEPEKASLRLAVQIGNQQMKGEELEEARILRWAAEHRNDQVRLSSVVVGDVVPIVKGRGYCVTFRSIEALPVAEQ